MTMTTLPVVDANLPELEFIPAEGIDFTLDYRGLVDGQEAWEWMSCGPIFSDNYSSNKNFRRQADAVNDASTFLASVYNEPFDFSDLEENSVGIDIQLPNTSLYQSGVHFSLFTYVDREGVYWQGLCQEAGERDRWWGEADFSGHCSERGYLDARYAAADAIYRLHRQRDFSAADALTLCYELELPANQILADYFIDLTVSQVLARDSSPVDIDAMSLKAKEEAVIDQTEAAAFIADCQGWNSIAFAYEDGTTFTSAERYQEGFGVVLQIDKNDWAKWLAGYEILENVDSVFVAAFLG